jgi:asparagine synthase (glutamine-hydrolysing)
MGFSVPIRAWFRGELRTAVTEAVAGGELVRSGRVNAKAVRRLLDEHVSGKQNHDGILWTIMAFEAWCRRNNA